MNSKSNTYSFTLHGFKFDCSLTREVLHLEAELLEVSRVFQARLTKENVQKLSGGFLESPAELLETIQYANEANDSNTIISVNDDAQLVLNQVTKMGLKERSYSL